MREDNTIFDVVQAVMTVQMGGAPPDAVALLREFAAAVWPA